MATLPTVSLGRTVRRRRKALGFTIEQLAERAELSPNYLGTIENDRRDPSLSTLNRLAAALGVSVAELVGGFKGLSAEAIEIGKLYDDLTPGVRETLTPFLRSLSLIDNELD